MQNYDNEAFFRRWLRCKNCSEMEELSHKTNTINKMNQK